VVGFARRLLLSLSLWLPLLRLLLLLLLSAAAFAAALLAILGTHVSLFSHV